MPKEYTRDQLWRLYEKIPKELQEMIFAEETADNIGNVCEKNEIKEDEMSKIGGYVEQVLLGVLPPEEFQNTLEKELKLKKETAKEVFHEINRFIFFPVKESLAALYGKEIIPVAKPLNAPTRLPGPAASEKPNVKTKEKTEEKMAPPKSEAKDDTYRELIE